MDNTPHDDFNGLTPQDMYNIMYNPFSAQCVVELNRLEKVSLLSQSYMGLTVQVVS